MSKQRKGPDTSSGTDDVDKLVADTKKMLDKAVNEIGWEAASYQILFGTFSGWVAGFVGMRVGKVAGIGIGGGAFGLHYAHQTGYIDVNWDKLNKRMDKIADKIEKEATGSSPSWLDKAERYVDRKLDKAEDVLKKKQLKVKKWYHNTNGDEYYRASETHVFLASFVAGLAIGILCGR